MLVVPVVVLVLPGLLGHLGPRGGALSVSAVVLHRLASTRAMAMVDGSWSFYISSLSKPSLSVQFSIS